MNAHALIDQHGRVLIPVAMRKELNLHAGDRIVLRVINREIHLLSLDKVIDDSQILFKKLTNAGISDVDEFIADRKKEFLLETSKFNGKNL